METRWHHVKVRGRADVSLAAGDRFVSEDPRPYRLLFVCTGNICRSPMAQGLARWYADTTGRALEIRGASTLGLADYPADPNAVAVCAELGVDIGGHRSVPLSQVAIDWADYVLVMEFHHATHIRQHHPSVGERMLMLGNFGGVPEIADPIGGWRFQFRRSRDEIRRCVEAFIERLPRERRQ